MILRKVVDQLLELQQKFPALGEVEVIDWENTEYAVASIEYSQEDERVYIKFKECEDKC